MKIKALRQIVFEHYRNLVPVLSDPPVNWSQVSHKAEGAVTRYSNILKAIEEYSPKSGEALDVGVGSGISLKLYAKLFPTLKWHGIDVPWARFEHPELSEFKTRIYPCDLENEPIPVQDNRFQCAIFSEVAEHLPPSAFANALKEMHRVLAPGGLLIATSPNLTSLMNRCIFMVGRSPFHLPIREDKYGGGFPHIHLYNARDVVRLGRHFGFEVVTVRYRTYFTYALIQHRLWKNVVLRSYLLAERLFGAFAPALRDGWIIVLRKPKHP